MTRFLRLVWNAQRVRSQIEERAHTSAGIYKVNQDMLRDIELPVPPLEAQDRLVVEIEEQMSALTSLEDSLRKQLARAEQLKRALLHCAFDGRLVRQELSRSPVRNDMLVRRRGEQRRAKTATSRKNNRANLGAE